MDDSLILVWLWRRRPTVYRFARTWLVAVTAAHRVVTDYQER